MKINSITATEEQNALSAIGPCANAEQRIKDLYTVNTVAGWAKGHLKILSEMAADHKLPQWCVDEIQRIHSKILTVSALEQIRQRYEPNAPSPCPRKGAS
jgi:hypothetical protein